MRAKNRADFLLVARWNDRVVEDDAHAGPPPCFNKTDRCWFGHRRGGNAVGEGELDLPDALAQDDRGRLPDGSSVFQVFNALFAPCSRQFRFGSIETMGSSVRRQFEHSLGLADDVRLTDLERSCSDAESRHAHPPCLCGARDPSRCGNELGAGACRWRPGRRRYWVGEWRRCRSFWRTPGSFCATCRIELYSSRERP